MVKLFGHKAEESAPSSVDDLGRPAVIDVRDITRTYEMGEQTLQVLKGITLGVYKGEFISIMGPSGSGKSTLMNILGALDRPTSGEYYLDGVDVSKMSETRLAEVRNKKIGFVFQSFNLLKRTSAIRQVELPLIYSGAPNRTKRAKAALEAVGLGTRLDHLPSELSGGQQQRVAIARAIVTEPAMILADEPTGNLDSKSGTEVMQIFQRLNRELGITTVFVTHDSWIARHTDRVIMIRDGRVVADHLIAAPLTAGEQERPSDDEELAGLLEEGYGRPGQAVIAVPEPSEQVGSTHVEPIKPTGSHAFKPTPIEVKSAAPVAPAVVVTPPVTPVSTAEVLAVPASAPFPFDNVSAPATSVETTRIEPAHPAVVVEPVIPFDDVTVPVEAAHAEIVDEPVAVAEPVIPFDDVVVPTGQAEIVDEPVAVVEPVIPFDDVDDVSISVETMSAPMAEAEPAAIDAQPAAEAPMAEVEPVEPVAEVPAPEPEIPAVEPIADVTPFDEPTHYPVADVVASVVIPAEPALEVPPIAVHDDAPASTVEAAPEPYIDERRDSTPAAQPTIDLSDFQGSEPTAVDFALPQAPVEPPVYTNNAEPDFVAQTSEPTVVGFALPQEPTLDHVSADNREPDFLTDASALSLSADNAEPDFLAQLPASNGNGARHDNREPDFLAHMSEPTVVGFKLPQEIANGASKPAETQSHEPSPLADWLDDATNITNGTGNGHVAPAPSVDPARGSADER